MSTEGKLLTAGKPVSIDAGMQDVPMMSIDAGMQDVPMLVDVPESLPQAPLATSAGHPLKRQSRPQRGTSGQVLNAKYELVREIGQGAMGSVWLARHLGWQAPVAVKVMTPPATEIARERFEREVRLAATLRSQHVVQLLDHGIDADSGSPFIVMELLEGESLADRLRRLGRLSPREVLSIVSEIGRALTRAHGAGIVHRDLKPANIFLVENGEMPLAKVLDFGIAKWVDNSVSKALTMEGRAVGTPWYMSPEQLRGLPIEARADLWSLAIIAFESLSGRRPFEEYDIEAITRVLCGRQRPIPSMFGPVPPGFDEWFARATAFEPAERFQSVHQLVEELRAVCASTPPERIEPLVSQRHSATIDSPSTPSLARSSEAVSLRRRPVLWASLLAVLLVSLFANVFLFTRRETSVAASARPDQNPTPSAPSTVSLAAAPAPISTPAALLEPPAVSEPPDVVPPGVAEAAKELPSGPAETATGTQQKRLPETSRPRRPRKQHATDAPPHTKDDLGTLDGDRVFRRRLD